MRPCTLHVAALISSVLAVGGCSAESETASAGQQDNDVQGGSTDTNAAHNFAVGITSQAGAVCSGTLIAPNLVLTARHCVVPPSNDDAVTCNDTFAANVAPSALRVTTEPNLYRAKASYGATEIIVPTGNGFCGNDLALIILERSVPAGEARPAIPVVQFKLTDRRLSGSITAMGYGITNPSAEDSGQRRKRENIPLLCIPGSKIMDCTGDLAKYSEDTAEFVTAGYVCSGDSGSGAFDQKTFSGGTPYVLGALSRGPDTADKCLAAIYSRTDAHAKLIIGAALKAATQGNYDPPSWTIPEAPPAANDPTAGEATCEDEGVTCDAPGTVAAPATGATKTTSTSSCSAARRGIASGTRSTPLALLAGGLCLAAVLAGRRRRR